MLKILFNIVDKCRTLDSELTSCALIWLDGILEDNRTRVSSYVNISRKTKKDHINILAILNKLLMQGQDQIQLDCASHILAMVIDEFRSKNCEQESKDFLLYLISNHKGNSFKLSHYAYSFAIMYLMKQNDLARKFIDSRGQETLQELLRDECQRDNMVAYNVICTFWILSTHSHALVWLRNYQNQVVENVTKILDFFNKEKIVRIVLMFLDGLKTDPDCLEQMSDINALNLVIKLQNRNWVDKEITTLLEGLWTYFDENY